MCQWAPWLFTGLGTEGTALAVAVFPWWWFKNGNRLLSGSFPFSLSLSVQWECRNLSRFCYRRATSMARLLSGGDGCSGSRSVLPWCQVRVWNAGCPQHHPGGHVPPCSSRGIYTGTVGNDGRQTLQGGRKNILDEFKGSEGVWKAHLRADLLFLLVALCSVSHGRAAAWSCLQPQQRKSQVWAQFDYWRMHDVVLLPRKALSLNIKWWNWFKWHGFSLCCGSQLWKGAHSGSGWSVQLPSGTREPEPECFSKGELIFQALHESWGFQCARQIHREHRCDLPLLLLVPTGCGRVPWCAGKEWNPPVRHPEQLWLVLVCLSVQRAVLLWHWCFSAESNCVQLLPLQVFWSSCR